MVRFICEGRDVSLAAVLAANVEVVAEAGSATMPQEPTETLAGLAVGDEADVVDISPVCQGPQRRRLLDLGVIPGTTIKAVMTSASGDPVAYEIRGALIALRHQQAEWIRVKRSSGEQGEAA
jgi:DtxR family Mn-dependent transcriptional regulator